MTLETKAPRPTVTDAAWEYFNEKAVSSVRPRPTPHKMILHELSDREIAAVIRLHNEAVTWFNQKPHSRVCPVVVISRAGITREIAFAWGGAIVIFVTRNWHARDAKSHSKRSLLSPEHGRWRG